MPEDEVLAGLLETYESAIAELERWNDPATLPLLESLRRLRERARGTRRDERAYELALS